MDPARSRATRRGTRAVPRGPGRNEPERPPRRRAPPASGGPRRGARQPSRASRRPPARGRDRAEMVRRHRDDGVETTRSRAGPGTTPAGTIRPRHEPSRRRRRAPLVRADGAVGGGIRVGARPHGARACRLRRLSSDRCHRDRRERRLALRARRRPLARPRRRPGPHASSCRRRLNHGRGRRRNDRDERVGAQRARALESRSGHLPHHGQVARGRGRAADRRGRRPVR